MPILDFIFPKKCLSCGREGKYLCESCLSKVQKIKLVCPYCERASIDGMTHAKCRRAYGLDGLVSIFDYEGVIRKGVLALKYRYATEIAAELLGNKVAKSFGWKCIQDLLVRKKQTTPQAELKGDVRRQNIRGVFGLSPNVLVSQHPNIILFDDVFTTGSTLKEAASVLKRKGVKSVWGLTIAR